MLRLMIPINSISLLRAVRALLSCTPYRRRLIDKHAPSVSMHPQQVTLSHQRSCQSSHQAPACDVITSPGRTHCPTTTSTSRVAPVSRRTTVATGRESPLQPLHHHPTGSPPGPPATHLHTQHTLHIYFTHLHTSTPPHSLHNSQRC